MFLFGDFIGRKFVRMICRIFRSIDKGKKERDKMKRRIDVSVEI